MIIYDLIGINMLTISHIIHKTSFYGGHFDFVANKSYYGEMLDHC